jgi:mycothiol synthase
MDYAFSAHGVIIRAPRLEELTAICELLNACDQADCGMSDSPLDQLRSDWQDRHFQAATDAWLAVASDGRLAAYAVVSQRLYIRVRAEVRVHPAFRGQGLGTYLLSLAEQRARQFVALAPAGMRVVLQSGHHSTNQQARPLLEAAGFAGIRHNRVMRIELYQEPALPQWPQGITLRPFVPERDAPTVFAAEGEAFQDHWGHLPHTFEDWYQSRIASQETFKPSLWLLAWEREQLAGSALCGYYLENGVVNSLSVRRPWRRRGLGMALLCQAFGEFYRRGTPVIELGVDSQNLTGATRLYERAGMRVLMGYDIYEKELRSGVDWRVETPEQV